MLKIDKRQKRLFSFHQLTPVPVAEHYPLRQLILNSPREFCRELGEELFLVLEELWSSEAAGVRPDLVFFDPEGNTVALVVDEAQGSALARAIASMGVIAESKADDVLGKLSEECKEDLQSFLRVGLEEINRRQRMILVTESQDAAVLTATRWLRERSGVDIGVVRVSMAVDSDGIGYLSCNKDFESGVQSSVPSEAGHGAAPPMATQGALARNDERRSERRVREYEPQGLTLGCAGQIVAVSHVIDFSDGGLGAEMLIPVPVGSNVTVAGGVRSNQSGVKLEGRARVVHCRSQKDGMIRIGLAFGEILRLPTKSRWQRR